MRLIDIGLVVDPLDPTKTDKENNAENLLIIHDKKLAERYTQNWKEHYGHSEVYVGKGRPPEGFRFSLD